MSIPAELGSWPLNLPTLQTGETLYSWCATVHRRQVSGNAIATSKALFGSKYAALLHDFPAHLNELEQRTANRIGPTRFIALRHTLLGYFLPFIQRDSAERIIASVLIRSVPDLKMRLGIPASGVGGYHPLRCCKECIESDRQEIGWPIWHLRHQAPTALVCTKHHRPLLQVWRKRSPVHERQWLVPSAVPSSDKLEIKVRTEHSLRLLSRLALMSEYAMSRDPGTLSGSRLANIYRMQAQSHGALTAGGSVRHTLMAELLRPDFESLQDAFAALGPVACQLDRQAIVGALFRAAPKPAHPFKHLVLLTSMFRNSDAVVDALDRADREVNLPEVVATKAADATDEIEVKRELFISLATNGTSVRSSSIQAGVSVSTGVRWAKHHGVQFSSRAKTIDDQVIAGIHADARLGLHRESIARNAQVSLSTVNRLLSSDHSLRNEWKQARYAIDQKRNRACILKAIAAMGDCSQRDLRSAHGASWTWLYRHDREWLATTLPALWSRSVAVGQADSEH